ncbi:MAG: hypothetical protein KDE05_04560 [Parvularculaceae bacterium]|nr:hypothetical protein [Parvularculaceae bacterium]
MGEATPPVEGGAPSPARSESERLARLERTEQIALRISVAQTVLAIIGFFVGVIALYAAMNEADAVRKQQQASVWPHIRVRDLNIGVVGQERFDIIVGNRGIGPAVVKYVQVVIDGEEQTNWYDVIKPLAGDERIGISHEPILGAVISPNEDITVVSVESKYASPEIVAGFRDLVRSERSNLIICYCSVFDDCWRVNVRANEKAGVDTCPAPHPESQL